MNPLCDLTPQPRRAAAARARRERTAKRATAVWSALCLFVVAIGLADAQLRRADMPAPPHGLESRIAERGASLADLREQTQTLRDMLALIESAGGDVDWSLPLVFLAGAAEGRVTLDRLSLRQVDDTENEGPPRLRVDVSAFGVGFSRRRLSGMVDLLEASPVIHGVRLDRVERVDEGETVRFTLRARIEQRAPRAVAAVAQEPSR